MLKIIHTSDWHLGKKLHGQMLAEDHQLFLDWLHAQIHEEKPDWLLISGDVFDHANPSAQALEMYYSWLSKISRSQIKIIITGGNHDSPEVLQAPNDLLRSLGVHVVGSIGSAKEQYIIPLGENLVCAAIPYLRDRDIRQAVEGEMPNERIEAVRQGMRAFFTQTAAKMETQFPGCHKITMGHLFTQGVETSESEREIQVGNLGSFDAQVLEQHFIYAALGHIHRPQSVSASGNVCYSGSPIPLSFGENHPKQIRLLIWNDETLRHAAMPVPSFRAWLRFEGPLEEAKQWAAQVQPSLALPPRAEVRIVHPHADPVLLRQTDAWVHEINESHPAQLKIIQHQVYFADKMQALEKNVYRPENPNDLQPQNLFQQLLERRNIPEELHEAYLKSFGELLDLYYESQTQAS